MSRTIKSFFDPNTWTISHIIHNGRGTACAIIDSVLDYDPKSGRTKTTNADLLIDYIQTHDLKVEWILETHAHADHLSAAAYLKKRLGGKTAIGEHITTVQTVFKKIFNLEPDFKLDGSQFDVLLKDGEQIHVGDLKLQVLLVTGHTPACVCYITDGVVFVGDTLFMPDVGTARCDFPGGNADELYQSIQKILALPDETILYLCHDYPPNDRAPSTVSTVAEQRAKNIHIHDGITAEDFVKMRHQRDQTLSMPTLILPAIQLNIRAGEKPPAEDNGSSYFKIPIDLL